MPSHFRINRRDALAHATVAGLGLAGLADSPLQTARAAQVAGSSPTAAPAGPVQPIAPWGPLRVDGLKIELTPQKQYDLSMLFPSSISVNGQPILAAPIKLWIQIDEQPAEEVAGAGTWTVADPGRIIGTWKWTGQNIALEATRRIDDDGLIVYELTFKPGAPQRVAKLYLQIPLARGLSKYLLRFPRKPGDTFAAQTYDQGKWTTDASEFGAEGLYHPRSLICHNGELGLQWACDTDANMGSSVWGPQSKSHFDVDQSTDTMTLHFIDGLTPKEASARPFSYKFYLYPLPPRHRVAKPYRINRPDRSTRFIADFDLPATEGAGTQYRWMGSGLARTVGQPNWGALRAAVRAQGIGLLSYTIANCWPNADTLLPWSPEFRVSRQLSGANNGFPNPPLTQYAENGAGAPYSLDPTDLTNTELTTRLLARYRSMVKDLGISGAYFDVAQPLPQIKAADAWGRPTFHYPVLELRELMRQVAAFYWEGRHVVLQHPQNSIFPIVHAASADIWCPGEEHRKPIEALSSNRHSRKRYYSNLSDERKAAEWAPQVFGVNGVILGQIFYDPAGHLSDRNVAAPAYEYFATESMIGEALLRGMGIWHAFSDAAAMQRVFTAIGQARLIQATEFRPFDGSRPAWATSTDPNAKISGWQIGETDIVLVVVNRGDRSKEIPLALTFAPQAAPQKLYSASGFSSSEGRSSPYVSRLTGANRQWSIGIPQRCFALLRFPLQRARPPAAR